MLHFSLAPIDAPVPVLGPYFETFYAPLVGPTVVVLQRYLVRSIPNEGSLRVEIDDLAAAVGVSKRQLLQRQLSRMVKLDLLNEDPFAPDAPHDGWLVKPRVRTLNALQVSRLPEQLRSLHKMVTARQLEAV